MAPISASRLGKCPYVAQQVGERDVEDAAAVGVGAACEEERHGASFLEVEEVAKVPA